MPHVIIKNYPKNLPADHLKAMSDEVVAVISKYINVAEDLFSVHYIELDPNDWKEKVYDPEIKPHLNELLQKPSYEL